jgi:hypothetical protein
LWGGGTLKKRSGGRAGFREVDDIKVDLNEIG